MTDVRKFTSLKFLVIFFALFCGVLFFHAGKSSAIVISGANNTFPDTSPFGQAPSYTIVQVTGALVRNGKGQLNANTKMKARSTTANIYVPASMVGQTIHIAVIGACDGVGRDNDPWTGSTNFYIFSASGLETAINSRDPTVNCPAAQNIDLSFTARAPIPATNCGLMCTYAGGQDWFIYHFEADGIAPEQGVATRYLNAFSLAVNDPATQVGISDWALACDNFTYTISCPDVPDPTNGYSVVYSSFYGPAGLATYTQQIQIISSCDIGPGQGGITLYDLDIEDNTLNQRNMDITMQRNGVPETVTNLVNGAPVSDLPYAGIINWEGGVPGQLLPHPGFSAYNNRYMQLPGTDPTFAQNSIFSAGVNYALRIDGIDSGNALQILPVFTHCQSGPPGTCSINGAVNAVNGGVIYANDPVRFNVDTINVPAGRQLGVNGPAYGGGPSNGDVGNYLVSGNQFARGSPVGVGNVTIAGREGLLPTTGTTTMDDMMLGPGGDGVLTTMFAPGAPGTYAFNWALVDPGVSWQPQTICAGTLTVLPKPNITVTGHFYDADNIGINYPGISVITCVPVGTPGYVPPVTDGNGNYSFIVPMDTPFCIRAGSWPAYSTNAYIRPTAGESYLNCGGPFGGAYAAPNYCPGYGTYEYQKAGGFYNQPGIPGVAANIDRTTDNGYDIVFTIARTQISGTIYNAYNLTQKYAGVVLDTCVPGDRGAPAVTATTNAAGQYSFAVRMGVGFCIRPNQASSGGNWPSNNYNVRPWNEGYWVCPGYTAATSAPNYCASAGSYECQQSIDNVGVVTCGATVGDFDRAADSGYDFAFRFPPAVSCTVTLSTATVETGVPFDLNMTGQDVNNAFRPAVSSGTYFYDILGFGGNSGALPALVPRGSNVPVSSKTYTINSSGAYPITANITAIGDGISSGPVTCVGPTQVVAATHPYFRVYGADTVTGSGFSTTGPTPSCTSAATNIYAFANKDVVGPSINYRGSGTQYGAIASGNILGFFTAANRHVVNTPPKSLSFANTAALSEYGGNYGLGTPCITDYFSDPSNVPAPVNGGTRDLSLTSANGGETAWGGAIAPNLGKHRYLANANLTINGLSVPVGTQAAIYVDGDLTISNDITFAGGAVSIDKLPNLAVIVRGNIFITPTVKRIDGLYVAQPRVGQEAAKGRIYTCALAFAQVAAVNLATTCGTGTSQLAINGSLIAQQVKFLRTMNSTRDSTYSTVLPAGEVPNFLDGSGNGGGANTKAAEVINYTPEMYIAPSALKNPDLACIDPSCKYDAIYSLPPVY